MRPLVIAATLFGFSASEAQADAFEQLRSAYAERDAAAAAKAYGPDAVVTYRYDGSAEERHVGSAAIARSFQSLFDQIDPKQRLDLNFRTTQKVGNMVSGYYRLRIAGAPTYGTFTVTLDGSGKFASDLGGSASMAAFEEASGPLMFANDGEDLERAYYGKLTGRYRAADGCYLVVTRSIVRMFVRDTCTNQWRGLNRVSGREWTAGNTIVSEKKLVTYRFAELIGTGAASVAVEGPAGTRTATRRDTYRREDVSFTAGDGTRLTGTIYLPVGWKGRRPGSVMLHGSGAQDRDGYASIIGVLADQLADSGRVVLAYDKRGSGGSDGDGNRAGFDLLADDAMAAMSAVRARAEVDPARVGLAGSSQAGWVAAKAIARGAKPADVLLLGAAGAAISVAEQNLYNTDVRLQCAKVAPADRRLALRQQRAFFDFLGDSRMAGALDAVTAKARARPVLADWLFPDSRTTDRSAGAWYVVLDPAFDPLPLWRAYRGRTLFLFAEHDDATPTREVLRRLAPLRATVKMLRAAQHLGLRASDRCNGELNALTAFSNELMPAIATFAQ